MSCPPPRNHQVDASQLDQELVTSLLHQLGEAAQFFLRNPLDYVGPEVEALLRIILWRSTLCTRGSSVGQESLGIRYLSPSPRQLAGLAIIEVGLRYLDQRQGGLASLVSKLPGSPNLLPALRWAGLAVTAAQLGTSLSFLVNGRHASPASWVLGLRPAGREQARTVAYSYMSRELLWHSFTELLIFLLPLLNSPKLRARIRSHLAPLLPSAPSPPPDPSKCAACAHPPVLPSSAACGHSFCYYCLSSLLQAQASSPCPACGETISEDSVTFLT